MEAHRWREQHVVGGQHQRAGFHLGFDDSSTCTAIWSPSEVGVEAEQTSGCNWMAFAFDGIGSNAWMPKRCSVGARFSITGCSLDDLFQDVPHHGRTGFNFLLGRLDGGRVPMASRRAR